MADHFPPDTDMMPTVSISSPMLATGLLSGIGHAGIPVLVVCGVIALLSVRSWAVIVAKLWMLSRARKANRAFLGAYHHSPHPLAIFQMHKHHAHAPLYHLYHAASRELAFHLLGTDQADSTFASRLHGAGRITPSQMNAVVTAMDRASSEARVRLEVKLDSVAVTLGAAPFLGLLGTAWGVMDALATVAAGGAEAATLHALAPALSGALLPTVAALLLSVPGFLGYHFVLGRVHALVVRQDHFASEFASVLDRHFVDHRPNPDEIPSIGSLLTPNMPSIGAAASRPRPEPVGDLAAARA